MSGYCFRYGICPYPHLLPAVRIDQLFDGANVALIDPLGISDWSPLKAVLRDTGITKFLHAGSEIWKYF